jgi:DNA primase
LGDDKRKYVNTKDTAVYNKNKFLFSMNIAKNSAVKDGKILLCEGNLDVISLTQAGFENAVASCGTALTQEQAKLISSYAKEAVICYDSDEAGQKATQKAIGILSAAGLKTTVIRMKGAKDPDEYIKNFGSGAFRLLLEKADGAINYELSNARAAVDMTSDSGKMEYKDSAVRILAAIESPVECDYYGHKVAEELDVAYSVLVEEIKRAKRYRFNSERKKQTRDMLRFADRRDSFNPDAAKYPGEAAAEEMIICYLYNNPDYYSRIADVLPTEKFVTEFNRRVYGFLLNAMGKMEDYTVSSMNEHFSPDEIGRITKILERGRNEGVNEQVANDSVNKLLNYKPKENVGELSDDDFTSHIEELRKRKNN